jgi:Rps23 Pro-64 3,4-dihydroxylase Tpa1-like proline 4-hydroxylase
MINDLKLPDKIGSAYKSAYPFPCITIDNFLNDYLLDLARIELSKYDRWYSDPRSEQINKEFAPNRFDAEGVQYFKDKLPLINKIIDYLFSKEALEYLERLTGIEGLIGDPELSGGGIHRIHNGGKLDIHADFNWHDSSRLWRRVNLLLYLNKDWQDEWGGHLELWERDLSKCCIKIAPIFNRAAIFNITDDAFHGHPHPLTTPEGVVRDSIALYYYTQDRPEHEKSAHHPVLWQKT